MQSPPARKLDGIGLSPRQQRIVATRRQALEIMERAIARRSIRDGEYLARQAEELAAQAAEMEARDDTAIAVQRARSPESIEGSSSGCGGARALRQT